MRDVLGLVVLLGPVLAFTAGVILVVGAPAPNVVSGLMGATVPVLLIYAVLR